MYCIKCKRHTETTSRNGRLMQKGYCAVCGKVKTKFIKSGTGILIKWSINFHLKYTCRDIISLVQAQG